MSWNVLFTMLTYDRTEPISKGHSQLSAPLEQWIWTGKINNRTMNDGQWQRQRQKPRIKNLNELATISRTSAINTHYVAVMFVWTLQRVWIIRFLAFASLADCFVCKTQRAYYHILLLLFSSVCPYVYCVIYTVVVE